MLAERSNSDIRSRHVLLYSHLQQCERERGDEGGEMREGGGRGVSPADGCHLVQLLSDYSVIVKRIFNVVSDH